MYHASDLQKFLEKSDYEDVDGEYTLLDTFVADFHVWLAKKSIDPAGWPRDRVRSDLAALNPAVGPGPQNKLIIGNLTKHRKGPKRWTKNAEGKVRLA